jgi:hypothetical protein
MKLYGGLSTSFVVVEVKLFLKLWALTFWDDGFWQLNIHSRIRIRRKLYNWHSSFGPMGESSSARRVKPR